MTMVNLSELMTSTVRFYDRDAMAPIKRLSSGLKINDAVDDPSSIAIINNMKGTEYGLLTSIENALDGISMIQTIDGYLSEMNDMVIRIKELSIRSANDAILKPTCRDRAILNAEAQQLIDEIDRQAKMAVFNGKPVLQGDLLLSVDLMPGSDQAVVSTGTASSPSWLDEDTVVYTDEVTDTGAGTGARPSSAGGTSYRVFTQDIDLTTNLPVGAPSQVTSDPTVLVDTDGDGFFDRATGGINDPQPNDALYPLNDPDADGDGYRATVDDDDSDATETGTGLNSLDPNISIPITGTAYEQDFTVTWNNTVTREFGADRVLDKITVNEDSGADYTVQVYDRDPLSGTFNSWVTVGANTGTGADQLINFGGDFTADKVRVVIDDPVVRTDGAPANVTISDSVTNDVEVAAIAPDTPPDTYKYSAAGPLPYNIDTFELQVTAGTDFTIYADDGSGPVAVLSGQTGTGATERYTLGAALVDPVDFYVELDAPGGVVSNFEAFLDTEHAGGWGASAYPLTYEYDVSGVAFTIDTIRAEVTAGIDYEIYTDSGAGGPDPANLGPVRVGTGALDSIAVAPPPGTTEFYVDLNAAAGAVTQFYVEDEIATGGAAASPDYATYEYNLGGPTAIDEIQVDATDPFDVYVDGVYFTTGIGGAGVESFAYAGPAASQIQVEMVNPALGGTINSMDALNLAASVGGGPAAGIDHVFDYNFGPEDLNHLEIVTTAAYEVFVDGVSAGNGAAGTTEFDFATVNASQIRLVMDDLGSGIGTITSLYAANRQSIPQADATRSRTYTLGGGAQDFTHIDLQVTAGVDYEIYDDTDALIAAGTGTGALEEMVVAGNSASLRVDVPVGYDSTDILDIAVREETTPGVGAQSTETRFYRYDVTSPPQEADYLELDLNAAVSNVKITDSLGGTIYDGAAAAGVLSVSFGPTTTDYFNIELSMGNTDAVINGLTATNTFSLAAPAYGFADIDASNENVAVYTLDNSGGNGYLYFDQLEFDVLDGHDYTVYAFDGAAWNPVVSGIGQAGAEPIYNIEDYGVSSEIVAQKIKIVLESGNDAEGGEAVLTTVTNRIDRDGDYFPDAIEDEYGSDPDSGASLPFGAVAGVHPMTPGPDDDEDGFLDYTLLYDTFDDAANPPAGVDLNNPYNFSWQDGTGNNLFTWSGNQLDPEDVPTQDDADGDTLPDPLDPFAATPEFTTWVDGASAYRGGTLLFISNRDNPTSADQDVYWLSGGTYSRTAPASADNAENPTLNGSGTAGAWDEGGSIYGYMQSGISCGIGAGTITFGPIAGENPAFNDDTSEIAFEDGAGKIKFADIPAGNPVNTDHDISGYCPDWRGDEILYTAGAGESEIMVYNLVASREFGTGLIGTNPTFQAGGSADEVKIAYETGGTVRVATLEYEYEPNYIQVGPENNASNRIDFSYPDARAKKIGIGYVAIDTLQGAKSAMDSCDTVLDNISDFRAEAGQTERELRHIIDDLYQQHINVSAARSNIEDADMASEYTELARVQILKNSAFATSAQASDILAQDKLGAIRESVGVESISRFLNR